MRLEQARIFSPDPEILQPDISSSSVGLKNDIIFELSGWSPDSPTLISGRSCSGWGWFLNDHHLIILRSNFPIANHSFCKFYLFSIP